MDDIALYPKILSEYADLPKLNTNPTFMDLCQLGRDRFEERCSQILKFFLDPKGPHNLKSLLLTSLLEVLKQSDLRFSPSCTKVITEEMTDDGRFIDITIVSDSMVIAIENKIYASLYNPLCSYATYIKNKYPDKEPIFVVLSVKSITKDTELQKINDNKYTVITYDKLFEAIKRNLGYYALDADQSYLTFLLDFIRTIENRYFNRNMELKKFFYNNRGSIDSLIGQYENFKTEIYQAQKVEIATYLPLIRSKTGADWWVYQGRVLGTYIKKNAPRIGIECVFEDETYDNPLGDFHIYVTTWDEPDFGQYKQAIKEVFPNQEKPKHEKRIFILVGQHKFDDQEGIINTLADTYSKLKDIIDKHK